MQSPGAIIIPCYNEANRLQVAQIEQFMQAHPAIDFWFVNDGSRDGTAELLTEIKAAFPLQTHILNQANAGKAAAVRKGIIAATAVANYKWVAFLDADFSAHPREIVALAQKLIDQDLYMAAGIRLKHAGATIKRSFLRHTASRIFVTFCYQYLGIPNYDTQCGAKVFSVDVAKRLFQAPFLSTWIFDMELIVRAMHYWPAEYPQKVKEFPLQEWRIKSGSKLNWFQLFYIPGQLVKIKNQTQENSH